MGKITPFIREPLEFEIVDGVMQMRSPDGSWELAIPLRAFRINMARAQAALDAHDNHSAEVRRLRPGSGEDEDS